ncbi:MAG: glucosamine-6-phosphate deaminase [Acidimicrobiia bacterium]|nr:glucosamine-6-phosphate deaminase [Acidimicrobiia bacterium]
MEVIVERDVFTLARTAADLVQAYMSTTGEPRLGLATGGSVADLYRNLVLRSRKGWLDFGGARIFLLDDYVGLGRSHPQRYANVVMTRLARHVDLDPHRLHAPDGDAGDLAEECSRYEDLVCRSEVGLQILGIGRNGHLAFNEPGSCLESRTRVVELAEVTRADNARYFPGPEDVPFLAITQGLATIRQAGHLVVLATGSSKARAVRAALQGPVTSDIPASAVQLHPRVTVLLDPSAAALTRFGPA